MNIKKQLINLNLNLISTSFHVKQAINKRFKDYFDKNQFKDDELDEFIDLKQHIFKILDAKDLEDAKNLLNELFTKKYPKNKFTIKSWINSPFLTLKN